jgi:hypothetical protein
MKEHAKPPCKIALFMRTMCILHDGIHRSAFFYNRRIWNWSVKTTVYFPLHLCNRLSLGETEILQYMCVLVGPIWSFSPFQSQMIGVAHGESTWNHCVSKPWRSSRRSITFQGHFKLAVRIGYGRICTALWQNSEKRSMYEILKLLLYHVQAASYIDDFSYWGEYKYCKELTQNFSHRPVNELVLK